MRAILLSLSCCALFAADAVETIENPETWQPQAESITITKSLRWNNRKRPSEDLEFEIQCKIKPPADQDIHFAGRLEVESIETDAGAMSIRQDPLEEHELRSIRQSFSHQRRYMRNNGGFTVEAELQNVPPAAATRVTKLVGYIDCELVTGEQQQVRLSPAKDWIGKAVEVEGLDGLVITISQLDPLTLSIPTSYNYLVNDLVFRDGGDRDIPKHGWSGHGSGDLYTYEYRLTMPENGAIIVILPPPTRTVRLPITLNDIPLPGNGSEESKTKTIKVSPEAVPSDKPAAEEAVEF